MAAVDAAKEYAAGCAAGVATVVTGHPFDTVKKLLVEEDEGCQCTRQLRIPSKFPKVSNILKKPFVWGCTAPIAPPDLSLLLWKVKLQAHNTNTQVKEYRNALHCASRILSTEGVKGLYRGASSSFIGMAIESSVSFGLYSQMKQLLQGGTQSNEPQLQAIVPSAAFAGAVISFILCPAELVKCRMQVQGRDTAISTYVRYSGPLDCALTTVRSEGVTGIFRGGFSTLLRESIGTATFFSTYELSRHYLNLHLTSLSSAHTRLSKPLSDIGLGILSGGVAGMAFWTVVLPFDVAKTIIQTSPDPNSSRNPFETLYSIYQRVGLRGCYSGLGPTLVRAFPANAAAVVAWEFTAKFLGVKRVTEN